MTPTPPSSPGGSSLPPRHRPNLGDLAKGTTESDLWAFEEPAPSEGERPVVLPVSPAAGIPAPRDVDKTKARQMKDSSPPIKEAGHERIQINVSKSRVKSQTSGTLSGHSKPGSEFDDLEQWDEPAAGLAGDEIPREIEPASVAPSAPAEPAVAKIAAPPVAAPEDELDEFSPVVRENTTPVSLRPRLGLSKVERAGMVALLVILLIAAGVIFFHAIHRLPTESARLKANDFPVKGSHATILAAESYWRAPIMEGENVETFRRGTLLLPVVKLKASGGPAAIRVFFRNSDGQAIGDAVTRTIHAGTPLQVAATAGFEDVGMHAAYRTGQSKPWTIQVYEAASENSPVQDFKMLFELDVSTDRR